MDRLRGDLNPYADDGVVDGVFSTGGMTLFFSNNDSSSPDWCTTYLDKLRSSEVQQDTHCSKECRIPRQILHSHTTVGWWASPCEIYEPGPAIP